MSGASEVIRFLADEDFRRPIVIGLRRLQQALDIQTAAEVGILGLPDRSVLAHAARDGRILLSHDINTMPVHFDVFLADGLQSPGLLLIAQTLPIGQAIEVLVLVWEASRLSEWRNRRVYLPL